MKNILTLCLVLFLNSKSFTQTGITWGMGTNIAANTFGNMHPRIALDAAGNPLVIWGKMADKSVYFSRWNGSMFTAPVKLNPGWLSVATASWMGPDIASHGDTVYVVMKRTPEASDTNFNYIMRSFDGGQTFSAPARIDNIMDSMSRFPTVTTDDNGNPIVAFMKFNNGFMDSRWVVTKSTNFGTSFNTDVKASGWGGSAEVCDCCPGAIIASGNKSALLYRDNNTNIRDVWMGISSNGAASYSSGFNTDNHNWMFMSCPSTGPDGIIVGDTVYSVFMNGALNTRNYYSKASLSGTAATAVTGIAANTPGLTSQNYPRIAHYGNAAAIAWVQSVSGTTQLALQFSNNILNGFPAVYDTVDLNDITNTDVAMANGKIFVVWEDDASGTVKYRSGTYNIGTAVSETIDEALFSLAPNPATNSVQLRFPAGEYKLRVVNQMGQIIFSQAVSGTENDLRINTAEWSMGVYYFSLNNGAGKTTKKFLKE